MDLVVLVLSSVINIVLALLVYFRSPRRVANRLFFFFILSVLVWAVSNYLVDQSGSYKGALFWTKVTFVGSYFIPLFLLCFSLNFPVSKEKNKKIYFYFIPSIFLSILTFTNLIIRDLKDINIHPIAPIFGPVYYLFVFYFLVYIIFAFIKLLSQYHRSVGLQRAQVRYLFLGLLLSAIFGGTTNLILPFFNYSNLSNFGVYSTIFFVIFTSYAIIRHRLLEVRLVLSRSLIYFLLIATVSFLYISIIFLFRNIFSELGSSQVFTTIITSLIIVFGIDPLKKLIARLTDKVFFKAPIDYQEVLRVLSEKISIEVEIGALLQTTSDELTRGLKLKHAEILITDKNGNFCRRDGETGSLTVSLLGSGEAVRYLKEKGRAVEKAGLERKIEDTADGGQKNRLKQSLEHIEALGGEVIAPITLQKQLNAVLVLGPKQSGDTFNADELRLFAVLGPQIGSAIEKAKLYSEVKSFSHELEQKVDEATLELKERNRFLLSLQEMTSVITHSLDYKKVTQQLVDGIAKELGYIGGILILRNKQTGAVWAEAITNTPVTRAAVSLLPRPVTTFRGSIRDVSLTNETIMKNEIRQGTKLSDFLSPALPQPLALALQKVAHINYLVAVPISSEEDVVGALVFAINKKKEQISEQEIAMMKSLADQAGIVLRNVRFFEAIQKANAELEKANTYLRALDVSKSEFISIASHQLRTPMTGIKGYLSMLVDGDYGKIKPTIAKILQELLGQSERMIKLINIFLNISKIESGKFDLDKRPTQIERIIQTQFVELMKLAKDKKLELLYVEPKPPLPTVNVDDGRLADVIQNLVENAIKYTEKGSVTVTTAIHDGMLAVAIQDTGIGISKGEAGKLFNKFVRGDGIARIHPDGSGLGLYFAKKIIEAHSGRIWVESEGEGKGSTFKFEVPV